MLTRGKPPHCDPLQCAQWHGKGRPHGLPPMEKRVYNMNLKKLSLMPLGALLLASCSSHRELRYFVDTKAFDEKTIAIEDYDYSLKIAPDDQLSITVSSLSPEATAMYNLPVANVATRGDNAVTGNLSLQSYIVDKEGDITFPMIGKLHVAGMTTKQLTEKLTELISVDVQNPNIKVQILNFAINVLGEVNRPGRLNVLEEEFSILDALAASGDLTPHGQRQNILLIRRDGDKITYHHFDLTDSKSLESPYFFLRQNDVIYVEPDNVVADNAKYNTNNSYKIQVVSVIVSTVSVIASLVIALTR